MDYNQVNEYNFNDTCRGYVIRVLKNAKKPELTCEVLDGLNWAFDEMTFENAREEYEEWRK